MDAEPRVVRSAAHFLLCQSCLSHGLVHFASGTTSRQIASLRQAEEEIGVALALGILEDDELPELRRQIQVTPLPLESEWWEAAWRAVEGLSESGHHQRSHTRRSK